MAYRVYDEFDPKDIRRDEDGALRVCVPYPIDGWLYGYLLSFGVGVEVDEEQIMRLLRMIQEFEPAGVGARGFAGVPVVAGGAQVQGDA